MNQKFPNAREAAQALFVTAKPMPLVGNIDSRDWNTICNTMQEHANAGRILSAWVDELQANLAKAESAARDAAHPPVDAEMPDQPRTIVLMYKPYRLRPDDIPFNDAAPYDNGGSWDVAENGDYQTKLDSREALALVAAMLLGAPHPRLQSIDVHEQIAARRAERRAMDGAEFTEVTDHE